MKERDYETKQALSRLIAHEEFLLAQDEKELKKLPKGYLVTRKKQNKHYYTLCDSSGEHGITKNDTLVYELLRKQYLKASISKHKQTISILNDCYYSISNIPHQQIESHINIYLSKTQLKWLGQISSQNEYAPEHLKYKCNNGIFVRSKSERTIANKLIEYNIIFKYESPLYLDGSTVYPDFTILRKDSRIIIWEHNGLMSNDEYLVKAIQKIRKYNNAGYMQHTNLICTEENDLMDEKTLDDIIFRYVLF